MKNNRRKSRSAAQPPRISTQIERPNIWSDWLANTYIDPLSWVQMAALLMRDAKPETIIESLAPFLDRTRRAIEDKCREWARGAPEEPEFLITYEDYREHFQDELLEGYRDFLKTLEGNADLEWLRDRLIDNGVGSQSFIWFLLNGIAMASDELFEMALDEDRFAPDARWLADMDFDHPSMMPGDEAVIRRFYEEFRETFPRAAPLPKSPRVSILRASPIEDGDDPYIARLAALEARQARQAAREYVPTNDPVDLPEEAWRQAMRSNAWNHALDLTEVPMFSWKRQVAFMLRDVSLDEVTRRINGILREMADATAARTIEDAGKRGRKPGDIEFGHWFKWWREQFRHWNDPLRAGLEKLCRPADAGLLADTLRQFEGAIFAEFLIACVQAHVIDNPERFGDDEVDLLMAGLSIEEPKYALPMTGLYSVTLEIWKRFSECHGDGSFYESIELDFEVDASSPLAKDQPGREARL